MNTNHAIAEPLVEADWIAEHLDDRTVRLVEVDVSPAAYEQGHIPGAVLWNAYADLRRPDYTPIGSADFERVLSRSGLTPETTVVFYGYGAHLGLLLMKACGHEQVRLMDGSRNEWQWAGHPWSLEAPAPAQTSYPLAVDQPRLRVSRDDVETIIGEPGHVILDVRSPAEYDGDCFWPSGAVEESGRAGHVPGSVHLPIDKLRTEDGRFREREEMLQALLDRGVTPDCRVVSYCTIGNRASQAWFAMSHLLDYPDTGVYYGSWAEWGTLVDTPVEGPGRSR